MVGLNPDLSVQLKSDVPAKTGKNHFSGIFHHFPLSLVPPPYLSLMLLPILTVSNCMKKAMMFACLSWDVGFKKPIPILLQTNPNGVS